MSKPIVIRGEWWLPNEPENRVSGMLRFRPAEIPVLELLGAFTTKNYPVEAPIILGSSVQSKRITLISCIELRRENTQSDDGMRHMSYLTVNYILVGSWFDRIEDIVFERIDVNFSNLEEWSFIEGERWFEKPEILSFSSKPGLTEPELQLNDSSIRLYHSFSRRHDFPSLNITQRTFFLIKPYEDKDFKYFTERLELLQIFLSLGVGQGTYPTEIIARCPSSTEPVSILYSVAQTLYEMDTLNRHFMLFNLGDILTSFSTYLQNWFDLSERLSAVYESYASALIYPEMVTQFKFLTLVQAVEAFHRTMKNGKRVDDVIYDQILDAIRDAISDKTDGELREHILQSVKYSNEFSLRQRFKDIWNSYEDALKPRFKSKKKYNSDIGAIVDKRNAIAHGLHISSVTDAEGILDYYNRDLRFILEVCLLSALGMPIAQVKLLVNRYTDRRYFHASIDLWKHRSSSAETIEI